MAEGFEEFELENFNKYPEYENADTTVLIGKIEDL